MSISDIRDIKTGLSVCSFDVCSKCPYLDKPRCVEKLHEDARNLITELQLALKEEILYGRKVTSN